MPPTASVIESLAESSPSRRGVSTHEPVAEKSTLVLADVALPKMTRPGPLVHSTVTGAGDAVVGERTAERARAGSVTGTAGWRLTLGAALSAPLNGPPLTQLKFEPVIVPFT